MWQPVQTLQGDNKMTPPADGIDPEFYILLSRSEQLLATAKLMRENEPVDWAEVHRLHNEISQTLDTMTAMVTPISR
jgi:hypothetical protein